LIMMVTSAPCSVRCQVLLRKRFESSRRRKPSEWCFFFPSFRKSN
jgi:hypothetical protein